MRKPYFVACEQQSRRPACASAQTDQRVCYALLGNYKSPNSLMQNFNILVSRCSRVADLDLTWPEAPKTGFLTSSSHKSLKGLKSLGSLTGTNG